MAKKLRKEALKHLRNIVAIEAKQQELDRDWFNYIWTVNPGLTRKQVVQHVKKMDLWRRAGVPTRIY